ncbi:hypothetical protein AEBE7430_13935 [Aeromonas bestiarum]
MALLVISRVTRGRGRHRGRPGSRVGCPCFYHSRQLLLVSPPRGTMISHIDHLVLTVSDIERAVAFYSSVLNMEAITFGKGRRALRFGNQKINLQLPGQEPRNRAQPGAGGGGGSLPHHPLAAGTGHSPASLSRGRDSGGARHQERRLRAHRVGLLSGSGSEPGRDQPLSLMALSEPCRRMLRALPLLEPVRPYRNQPPLEGDDAPRLTTRAWLPAYRLKRVSPAYPLHPKTRLCRPDSRHRCDRCRPVPAAPWLPTGAGLASSASPSPAPADRDRRGWKRCG